MPPLDMTLDPKADPPPVPPRKRPEGRPVPEEPARIADPFWLSMEFDDLQGKLSEQRARPSRIRVPTFEEVLTRDAPADPSAREADPHPMDPGDHGLPGRAGVGVVGHHQGVS